MKFPTLWALGWLVGLSACSPDPTPSVLSDSSEAKSQLVANMKRVTDNHSYSRPDEAVTTHLHWDAKVDFDQRQTLRLWPTPHLPDDTVHPKVLKPTPSVLRD